MDSAPNRIRRYTDMGALMNMLLSKSITFLDPESWDDRNDAKFMSFYKDRKSLSSLLAICFSISSETYHHWSVFAGGRNGVCLELNKSELITAITSQCDIREQAVLYKDINDLGTTRPLVKDLPFLKRAPYRHEEEYRMIWESLTEKRTSLSVQIPLTCILRINLSPWSIEADATAIKKVIRTIPGCENVRIDRSTLVSNDRWIKYGSEALELD
jgi:hypothetical protein